MSFIDAILGWSRSEQTNWTLVRVPAPAVPAPPDAVPDGTAINPNQGYVTVRMRSMAVSATRRGWSRFHAALYTRVSLTLRNGDGAVLQSILSPDFLHDLDSKRLQNVLQIDRTIFGPVPYIGTRIGFETGVFAVKDADLATPFLNTLVDLANTAGVGLVTAATPFIEPIRTGIELLTGTQDATSLEIALSRELQPPVAGWYALVREAATGIDASDLTVRDSNFELLRMGEPMPGVPYLLYSIDGCPRREDWAQIPDLKAAYADFVKAVQDDKLADARAAADLFARRARVSPELLPVHADDLINALDAEWQRVFRVGPAVAVADTVTPAELGGLRVTFRAPH